MEAKECDKFKDNSCIRNCCNARANAAFKAGLEQARNEYPFNPDYLDFQKGVKAGRVVGKQSVITEIKEFSLVKPDADSTTKFEPYYIVPESKLQEWGIS